MTVNRQPPARPPAQENVRLPTWLFIAMALFVMAATGSRALGLWQTPSLVVLVRPPVATRGAPAGGHAGEPGKPLDPRWRIATSPTPVEPVPGRWDRPLEPAPQLAGSRAP